MSRSDWERRLQYFLYRFPQVIKCPGAMFINVSHASAEDIVAELILHVEQCPIQFYESISVAHTRRASGRVVLFRPAW